MPRGYHYELECERYAGTRWGKEVEGRVYVYGTYTNLKALKHGYEHHVLGRPFTGPDRADCVKAWDDGRREILSM